MTQDIQQRLAASGVKLVSFGRQLDSFRAKLVDNYRDAPPVSTGGACCGDAGGGCDCAAGAMTRARLLAGPAAPQLRPGETFADFMGAATNHDEGE